ncbi:linear amide C-N hydrolase [Agrilactobacillus yilanensis]|uniref:Linear amide C-N hydrolase n=1 Tax=Agrilactobacillus yilanensis TaxID=2485997 RepID=A0ABW4J819_9LACO|nr:linear amide C-N hydrolase [Agrilactobacillus yilanensis]
MCTSLTLSKNHQPLLARTMDFPTTSPWQPIFIPRNYAYQPATSAALRHTKYAFIGGGRVIAPNIHLMADGVNEKGLACAELYFPFKATYHDQAQAGKLNLTPQDLIHWVLGEHASLAEVQANLPKIALVANTWHDQAQKVYPFHWLLTDPTGATLILEPQSLTLALQPDTLGVLTNTPDLANHLARLRQFLQLPATADVPQIQLAARAYHGLLPNRTIPTDRFIKMAILKAKLPQQFDNEALFACLDQVIIPKNDGRHLKNHDYTHYEMILNTVTGAYQFHDLNTKQHYALRLSDYLHQAKTITRF